MQTPNEVAAAILVQTLVDHHPQLQAEIRQDQPDPKALAQIVVLFYKAILDEMKNPFEPRIPEGVRASHLEHFPR